MYLVKRIGRNITFKFIAEIISRFFTFIFFIFLARKLGDKEFGLYSYLQSFCMLFLIILDPGINTVFIRNVAREKNKIKNYLDSLFSLKIVLFGIYLIFLIGLSKVLSFPSFKIKLLFLMAMMMGGLSFLEFFSAAFNSLEKMEYEALIKLINKILILSIGLSLLFLGYKIKEVLLGLVFAYFLTFIFSFHLVTQQIASINIRISVSFWKEIFRQSLPIALTTVFTVLFFRIDVVMLSWMGRGDTEVGWYAASIRLIDILSVIPYLIMGGVFPVFSDLFKNRKDDFLLLYEKMLKILILLGVCVAVVCYVFSQCIITGLYGSQFLKSISVFKIHIGLIPFIYLNYLLINLLTSMERQKRVAVNTGLCVPLNIILNFFLIQKYNYLGAGMATLFTQIFLFVVNYISVKK